MRASEQSRGFAEVWRVTEDLHVKGSREAIEGVTPGQQDCPLPLFINQGAGCTKVLKAVSMEKL